MEKVVIWTEHWSSIPSQKHVGVICDCHTRGAPDTVGGSRNLCTVPWKGPRCPRNSVFSTQAEETVSNAGTKKKKSK